jgi:hypothetical protein
MCPKYSDSHMYFWTHGLKEPSMKFLQNSLEGNFVSTIMRKNHLKIECLSSLKLFTFFFCNFVIFVYSTNLPRLDMYQHKSSKKKILYQYQPYLLQEISRYSHSSNHLIPNTISPRHQLRWFSRIPYYYHRV